MPPAVLATVAMAMQCQNSEGNFASNATRTISEFPGSKVADRKAASARPARPVSGEKSGKMNGIRLNAATIKIAS